MTYDVKELVVVVPLGKEDATDSQMRPLSVLRCDGVVGGFFDAIVREAIGRPKFEALTRS